MFVEKWTKRVLGAGEFSNLKLQIGDSKSTMDKYANQAVLVDSNTNDGHVTETCWMMHMFFKSPRNLNQLPQDNLHFTLDNLEQFIIKISWTKKNHLKNPQSLQALNENTFTTDESISYYGKWFSTC